jgi:predicted DNA-binding transcriptional regulator AlpA
MVSMAAVARRVNRAPQTLLRWINRGQFPRPVVLNDRRYFWPEQIDAWERETYALTAVKPSNDDHLRAPA